MRFAVGEEQCRKTRIYAKKEYRYPRLKKGLNMPSNILFEN